MAPIWLPGDAEVTYAGFTFTVFKSSITARPRPDSAGRTTKWVDFDINIERALVTPDINLLSGATTDAALQEMRILLNKTGQPLTFTDKGYGQLNVNQPGSPIRDAEFGPHPELLEWQPTGNDQNAFVSWRCKTSIPQCPDARYQFAVAEMNYTVEERRDHNGVPTLKTTGHLVIPMTRLSDTQIPDHVDRYKDQIETVVPEGFQRTNHSFTFNEAKTQLNFSWEDVLLKTPLPFFVTRAPITHKASSAGPAFAVWSNSLSGTIEMPPQVNKEYALRVFLAIAADRMATAQEESQRRPLAPVGQQNAPQGVGQIFRNLANAILPRTAVIPKFFSVSNDPTSFGVNFQFDWMVMFRKNIVDDVAAMGVWQPFPGRGLGFETWRRTMNDLGVNSVRGPAQLRWLATDDAIIDLCVPNARPPANPQQPATRRQRIEQNNQQQRIRHPPVITPLDLPNIIPRGAAVAGGPGEDQGRGGPALIDNSADLDPARAQGNKAASLPNPEASWLSYENVLIYREPRGRCARHRPLRGTVSEPSIRVDVTGGSQAFGRIRNPSQTTVTARKDTEDILQEIDAPFGVVILRGGALRLGEGTPLPNLLTCRGCLALRNRVIESIPNQVVGRMGDIPLILTTWEIEFLLDKPPKDGLPITLNPITGVDGGYLG